MKEVSNNDLKLAIRLLKSFCSSPCTSRKEQNDRRLASLLMKKWKKLIPE